MARAYFSSLTAITGWTGRRAIRMGTYPLDLTIFIARALHVWWQNGHAQNRATRRATIGHILSTGINPLPATLIVAFAVGFTVAIPLAPFAAAIGETEFAALLLRIIGLELGPVLTAVVVIGRAGSAMAAELANMKLHGETAALQHLGVDLRDFFIAPRLFAGCIAQLVLATYFTTVALFGGMLMGSWLAAGEAGELALATLHAVQPFHFLIFIGKNLLFGLLLAGAACYSAVRVGKNPTDVPVRIQQAITNGLVIVFLINGLLAAFWQ